MSWRSVAAVVLLVAGGSIELLAVLGLCVMRDVYDRLHYVGAAGFGKDVGKTGEVRPDWDSQKDSQ